MCEAFRNATRIDRREIAVIIDDKLLLGRSSISSSSKLLFSQKEIKYSKNTTNSNKEDNDEDAKAMETTDSQIYCKSLKVEME